MPKFERRAALQHRSVWYVRVRGRGLFASVNHEALTPECVLCSTVPPASPANVKVIVRLTNVLLEDFDQPAFVEAVADVLQVGRVL